MASQTDAAHALQALAREWEARMEPEDLARARYRERMRVARFVMVLVWAGVELLVWLPTGWAVALREALHGNAAWWRTGLVVLIILAVNHLLSLPLDWFFDYRLETRLGTNRQSLGGWLRDGFKQMAVDVPLRAALFTGLYVVFRRWPQQWLPGILVMVLLFLAGVYFVQPLLVRWQYKVKPLDDPALQERLAELFRRAGRPFAGIAVQQVGEKSSKAGAAVLPRGLGLQVVVTDTLLESMSPAAVVAVVAHELGHQVHRDMAKLLLVLAVALSAGLAVTYQVLTVWGAWGSLQGPGDVATFPLFSALFTWLAAGLQIVLNAYMRRIEYAADRFALEVTRDLDALEETFEALSRENKALPLAPRWVEWLLYDHPSLARRVAALRAHAARWAAS